MADESNNSFKDGAERQKGPSSDAFRKVKWIKRRRGLIAFFTFLVFVSFILFFDYYWVLITRVMKQPSQIVEKTAGKFMKVSEKERQDIFARTRNLLDAGKVEEARQLILKYLQKESNAEGFYLAGLVYMRQGDVSSAYRYFKEAIRLRPDYYEAQEKLAEVYVTVGDLKSAQETATILTKKSDSLADGLLLQSEISLAEGKLDEALNKVQAAIDAKKGAAPERSIIQLATLHVRKGDRAKADQIIATIDEKKLDATGLISLARYYQLSTKNEKALAIMNDALTRYPESPEVQYYYGQQLFSQGKYNEAIPHFQKLYSLMPHSRIASYRLGQAMIAAGQMKEAKKHIEDTLSNHPGDILALSLKVRYELLNLQRKEAIETLKHTIALVPDAPRPHTLLAELYWADGVLSVAEAYAQKAMKLGERSLSPRIILGDIYTRKGLYNKAVDQYGKILEREPTNLIALSQSADNYLNLGDAKRAESFYERIIQNYPNITMIRTKIELIRNLPKGPKMVLETAYRFYQQHPSDYSAVRGYVQALIINNRPDEAARVLKSEIAKAPKNVQYPLMLGDLFLVQKNVTAAKEAFQLAMKIAPNDLNLMLNIGGRYEINYLDKDAEDIYLKLQVLYPENILVVNQLAWFYTDIRGNFEKARPFVDTLRVKGEGAFEKDTVGWYLYRTRDYSSAEAYFREAIQMDPDNNVIRGHLAMALFQLNKGKEGFTEAEKVVKLIPSGDMKNKLTSLMEQHKKGAGK
ncbi:MAG: tetratricopeptide repeat protein [Syntrophales bacterium]